MNFFTAAPIGAEFRWVQRNPLDFQNTAPGYECVWGNGMYTRVHYTATRCANEAQEISDKEFGGVLEIAELEFAGNELLLKRRLGFNLFYRGAEYVVARDDAEEE